MNERIKELRKALRLTQQEFSERIGVKRNTVAQYEIGRNPPNDTVITLIRREFGVSEAWLRTGEGEMFLPVDADEELAQVLDEIKLSDDSITKAIIKSYWRLDDAGKAGIRQLVDNLTQAVQEDKGPEAAEKAPGN